MTLVVSALTVTVVPGTPLHKLERTGRFAVPEVPDLLRELRAMVLCARPTDATFRTNHASNYLPLGGHLPRDRARIVEVIDAALTGRVPLRPERHRGLLTRACPACLLEPGSARARSPCSSWLPARRTTTGPPGSVRRLL